MIKPNKNTPVARCVEMAEYTGHMLGKFVDRPRLIEMGGRMRDGGGSLEAAERACEAQERALTLLRIDVDYENYMSDQRVRRTRKQVEIHDGRRDGRVAAQVFVDGSLDFSRIQGAKQIDAMRSLEARIATMQDIWPEAKDELAAITLHRVRYADAIAARDEGVRKHKDLLANRNAVKERFLSLYSEIVSLVEAEFPRDPVTQRLFFLDAHEPRRAQAGDGSDDGYELPGEEQPGAPGAEPPATKP
jgi:hypothetical protein